MIVIDASVANKLVLPNEEGHEKAKKIFSEHANQIEQILSIDFLMYEVVNTLSTKSAIPQRKVTTSLTTIYKTQINIYHPTEKDVKESARLAKKYKTSVYDMLYAVVAKIHKVNLITADEKFVEQTGFKFIKLL